MPGNRSHPEITHTVSRHCALYTVPAVGGAAVTAAAPHASAPASPPVRNRTRTPLSGSLPVRRLRLPSHVHVYRP